MRPFAVSLSGRRSLGALLGVMALLGVAGAAPAGATVIEHERFSETDSFTDTECGFTLQVQSTASGQTLLRVDNGGQAFLQHTNVRFRDVATNPETGRSFVIRGHVLYNDVKATQISDTVYEFVAVEAGQPFVIEDAAGQVIVRDRGVIRHTFLFDTLGDSQPGGVFLVETDTAVHGPHPGFSPDFPFCEIAAELTGA